MVFIGDSGGRSSHEETSPCIFLLTGVMASGKSTVAQLLAESFSRGVHLRGDTFRKMIVSGRKNFSPNSTNEGLQQLRLRYEITADVADKYFDAGFTVVVQDVILGSFLMEFIHMIKNRPLYVVVLAPQPEVVARREAEREKAGYGKWTIADLESSLRTETPKIGLWIDSSTQSPQETADEILGRAWSDAKVEL